LNTTKILYAYLIYIIRATLSLISSLEQCMRRTAHCEALHHVSVLVDEFLIDPNTTVCLNSLLSKIYSRCFSWKVYGQWKIRTYKALGRL